MNEGVVRWFNYRKGYGFAFSEELNQDVFIHHSEFVDAHMFLHSDTKIIFEAVAGEKGLKAKCITLKD